MHTTSSSRPFALRTALPLTLLLTTASLAAHAAPGKAGGKAEGGRKGGAVKHAAEILGEPLNPAQKSAVRTANKERQQAIKPIQLKYKTAVAKALGITVAQYEQRENALRQQNKPAGHR